ncbi:uncharacterized protein BO96DRAFT_421402 [Aspergillus niger CBS 101883]|uniref:uncharacterized protein n=1 Tax=Aspergillus lacticoffeatus (strain CBS 101883) TaxID=1450533 RepID=UPI000D80106B|nr:uncharacterized protein BO96DRAFT_421402 [Aspergillus niger CBS 101883]PYH58662.1 hypothetical protein BO96DRAFT_421402 [Aspergillus niger CBS 101883]
MAFPPPIRRLRRRPNPESGPAAVVLRVVGDGSNATPRAPHDLLRCCTRQFLSDKEAYSPMRPEAHPVCVRCQRSKNRCNYGVRLQWEDDMRAAGKCHGRTGIVTRRDSLRCKESEEDEDLLPSKRIERKDQPGSDGESALILTPPSSHSPLRAATSESVSFLTRDTYHSQYQHWKESKIKSSNTTFRTLPWTLGVPDVDDVCLSFYESIMCPAAVTIDNEETNPLRNTVMRMVFRSELAYYSVLMTSAQYLRSIDSRFELFEMQVRQRVLKGLRQALAESCFEFEDVLLPTIFLCSSAVCDVLALDVLMGVSIDSQQISHSCDASWVRHLTCFQMVIKQKIRRHTTTDVPQLFLSYFLAHLVLAKSLFPIDKALPVVELRNDLSLPVEEGASWTSSDSLSKAMDPDTLHEIDVWTGMSNRMLLLINDILSLKDDVRALYEEGTEAEEKQRVIEAKIITLQRNLQDTTHLLPKSLRRCQDSAEVVHRRRLLEYTGESYRLAACLLLSEASTPAFLGYISEPSLGLDTTRKQRHVDYILSLVESIVSSLDHLPISWPLWPLFIASCCSTSESDKARALAQFQAAQAKAPYENTVRAQTVVELLWQRRELYVAGERTRTGRFEWELVMEFQGWQTSFA